jgi:hypothetical protein
MGGDGREAARDRRRAGVRERLHLKVEFEVGDEGIEFEIELTW